MFGCKTRAFSNSCIPFCRSWKPLLKWNVSAMEFLGHALSRPVGKAFKNWETLHWTSKPNIYLPPRLFTGPWAHANTLYQRILISGQLKRQSWFTCRAHPISAWRMKKWGHMGPRTGEDFCSECSLYSDPKEERARGEHVWIRGNRGGDIYMQVKHISNTQYGLPMPNPANDGCSQDRARWHIFHYTVRHKIHFKIPQAAHLHRSL